MKRSLTLVLLLALLCACGAETPADPGGQNYPQQNQLVFDGADYYALDAGALLRLDAAGQATALLPVGQTPQSAGKNARQTAPLSGEP